MVVSPFLDSSFFGFFVWITSTGISWFVGCFIGFIRRAELSLFVQGDVKMISFFPVRDIPLRFKSSNLIFSAATGRIDPIFVLALRRIHDLSYSKLSAAQIFFRELLAIKASIFRFFRGQRVFFWVLTSQ